MVNTNELFGNHIGLHIGAREAAVKGYAFVENGISELGCDLLQTEVEGLKLERGDHTSNPINQGTTREITQLHERRYLAVGDEDIPMATLITRALALRVKMHRFRYPELRTWLPNEAGYQLYRDPDHHISKHRDRRNDELLAATITISGTAQVGIHDAIDDPDDYTNTVEVDTYTTHPGTVMFLRATGLGNGEQVIHDVGPPQDGPRLILNLRMRPDILPTPSQSKDGA